MVDRKGQDNYLIELKNGKQIVYKYADIVAMDNREDENGQEIWTFEEIKDISGNQTQK